MLGAVSVTRSKRCLYQRDARDKSGRNLARRLTPSPRSAPADYGHGQSQWDAAAPPEASTTSCSPSPGCTRTTPLPHRPLFSPASRPSLASAPTRPRLSPVLNGRHPRTWQCHLRSGTKDVRDELQGVRGEQPALGRSDGGLAVTAMHEHSGRAHPAADRIAS
jgi:hypothetical protein